MSALAERIIAARDDMKRHFASHYVLSVMADAANAIVGQEALLKAENAARLDLQNLAADECARADKMRDLLTRAREYVTDALDAHEHSDGRDLLKEIDAALEAAAPHMLSAPEGVSEAEKDLSLLLTEYEEIRDVDTDFANAVVEFCSHRIAEHFPLIRQALGALSALSSERERAERAERERDEARGVVRDTLWMARRYADGRQSYAVGMYNDAAKIAEAGGYAKGEPDGTLYALDGLRPEYQTLETRAQAAEAKVKQAENLIAKARTLSDTLKAYGYPVSPAHWANASGQMSVQARALHMAAENLIEGLAALRWTQGEGE